MCRESLEAADPDEFTTVEVVERPEGDDRTVLVADDPVVRARRQPDHLPPLGTGHCLPETEPTETLRPAPPTSLPADVPGPGVGECPDRGQRGPAFLDGEPDRDPPTVGLADDGREPRCLEAADDGTGQLVLEVVDRTLERRTDDPAASTVTVRPVP